MSPPTAPIEVEEPVEDGRAEAFVIRRAVVSDAAAIWSSVAGGDELDHNSPYAYLMLCALFAETCLVAERDGTPVGFVLALRPPERPESVFVWQIGVDAAARGRGVGRRLLEELCERAAPGVRFVEATVTPSNTASRALFSGFARSRGAPCRISPFFPAPLFPAATPAHEPEELFSIGPLETPEVDHRSPTP